MSVQHLNWLLGKSTVDDSCFGEDDDEGNRSPVAVSVPRKPSMRRTSINSSVSAASSVQHSMHGSFIIDAPVGLPLDSYRGRRRSTRLVSSAVVGSGEGGNIGSNRATNQSPALSEGNFSVDRKRASIANIESLQHADEGWDPYTLTDFDTTLPLLHYENLRKLEEEPATSPRLSENSSSNSIMGLMGDAYDVIEGGSLNSRRSPTLSPRSRRKGSRNTVNDMLYTADLLVCWLRGSMPEMPNCPILEQATPLTSSNLLLSHELAVRDDVRRNERLQRRLARGDTSSTLRRRQSKSSRGVRGRLHLVLTQSTL